MSRDGAATAPAAAEKLARAQGIEEGLSAALSILAELAEVMLEREREADPRKKANYARRTRIKAYQVASRRIATRLKRQHQLLARLESAEDRDAEQERLRAAVEDLAL